MALFADQAKRISKRLSLHLRHEPQGLGLLLDDGGWVEIDALLAAYARRYEPLSRDMLDAAVAGNDKQRFAFDPSRRSIRASQGHSVAVDLGLVVVVPPKDLFHGTQYGAVSAIFADGLKPMSRQHVHLSSDVATAIKVGSRHCKPVVLHVAASRFQNDGFTFFRSDIGVWLIDHVPPQYLRLQV